MAAGQPAAGSRNGLVPPPLQPLAKLRQLPIIGAAERQQGSERGHRAAAELAFQFVKWAILRGDERTRAVVDAEIERVRLELASTAARIDDSGDDARLARSGVLGPELARSVRVAGLEFAVLPGLESLIEAASALRAA